MQARIAREGEIVVIHLSGHIDVETAEPFRKACLSHLSGKKVVFDFRSLNFVGSSGILPFLETMQEFASTSQAGFKFSGVGSEFKKVFAATPLQVVEIFETPQQAVHALLHPVVLSASMAVQAAPIHLGVSAQAQQTAQRSLEAMGSFGLLALRPQAEESGHSFDDASDDEALDT